MTVWCIWPVRPDRCEVALGPKLQVDTWLLWPHTNSFPFAVFRSKGFYSISKTEKKKRINTNGAGSNGLKRQGNYPAITAAFRSWGGVGGRDRVLSLKSMDVVQLGQCTHRHSHPHVQPSKHKCNLSSLNSSGSAGPALCSFCSVVDCESNTHFVFLAVFPSFSVCMSESALVRVSGGACLLVCVWYVWMQWRVSMQMTF